MKDYGVIKVKVCSAIFILGFVGCVLIRGSESGERLQDLWSSGLRKNKQK